MALAKHSSNHAASTREFKHRVLTCLNKLSDRDTHSAAASELESIAKTLSHDCISPFLSSISATDSSDKSPVRKQCVRLISLLSESHGDTLSPHLSKLLSAVVRRLRDPDSVVRSACISATASISSHITKPPFTSIAKPLIDALVTEQDQNSQIGAALCLASAIDGSPDPEPLYLRRLLPRLEKLLKCNSFKAKPALLTLFGSVIEAGASSGQQTVRDLLKCLVEFVSSEDWAARKGAAEALGKLAVAERDLLSEFKASCLKTFEAKRFDKVKVVRETMNQMVEAWKAIPDVADGVSAPRESQSSSKEVASDGRYPPGGPQIRKKHGLANSSHVPNGSSITTAAKRSPLESSTIRKTGPAMFRKLERKKPSDWKIDIVAPSAAVGSEDVHLKSRDENVKDNGKNGLMKTEIRRALFDKNSDEKVLETGVSRASARVVQCYDERSESTAVASNITEDVQRSHRDCEDLSLIRKQLVQIENQQSSLFDLLQKFIGSSQNGMCSLESRVHGLELALDEISFDLARSTGRMATTDSTQAVCCKLPGADFLSSKLWRKPEGRYSNPRFSSSGTTPPTVTMRNLANKNVNTKAFQQENRQFRFHGGNGGLIVNPLAEVHSYSHGISEVSSSGLSKNFHRAA